MILRNKKQNQLSNPSKNSCSSRDWMVGLSSASGCRQLTMKLLAASDSFPGLHLAFLQSRSSGCAYAKQEGCSCFRLSTIWLASSLSFSELQGCSGDRSRPVAVSIRTARHPRAQTSFFSDLEKPLERRNSGAQQWRSLLAVSSSLEGTKDVARTALMKSSPFWLQSMAEGVMRLWARRQQCMCCRPTATCLRYLRDRASPKGPNSSSRLRREQFLYSSESTNLFPWRETSAQMGRMLGCSKLTFSLRSSGIRLTKRFSRFQYPVSCPHSSFPSLPSLPSLLSVRRISSSGSTRLRVTNSIPAEVGLVGGWSTGRCALGTRLSAVFSGGGLESGRLSWLLRVLSLSSKKMRLRLASNSSLRVSCCSGAVLLSWRLSRMPRMLLKRSRNLLLEPWSGSLSGRAASSAEGLRSLAERMASKRSLNLLLSLRAFGGSWWSQAGVVWRLVARGLPEEGRRSLLMLYYGE